jgi:hypothetical protein
MLKSKRHGICGDKATVERNLTVRKKAEHLTAPQREVAFDTRVRSANRVLTE